MTLARAQQLLGEHHCRQIEGHPLQLEVVNEAINMQFTMPLYALEACEEDVFISTITTGHPPMGQSALPGIMRDYQRTWFPREE
jgi:hypothetical protein